MRKILLSVFFIPVFLFQGSKSNDLRAQTEEAFEIIDTAEVRKFTLFPDEDPFQSSEPIRLTLEFDMRKLIREKNNDNYHDAVLRWDETDGSTTVHNLKIRARGERRKTLCRFPPITLNFKKSELDQEYMNNVNKLKLVTHCMNNSETFQQYLFKEFLIYKMFNLLTENSFRVRLFIIEYKDTKNKMESMNSYGFIIESNSLLANRLNGVIIEKMNIATWYTEPRQLTLMSIFQFMIGNTDWAVPLLHNIRLVSAFPAKNPIPIPYDFDYSGMVNTHYSTPHESLPIVSVRDRLYLGICLSSEEEYPEYFRQFLDVKEDMYALVRKFELLDSRNKEEMIDYLDSFFTIIEDPRLARRNIINACGPNPVR